MCIHSIGKSPRNNLSRVPINHCWKIYPPFLELYIRYICRPYLVHFFYFYISQKVGIYLMFLICSTCSLLGVYRLDTHKIHKCWNLVTCDIVSSPVKLSSYPSCSVKRRVCVYLVYLSHYLLLVCITFASVVQRTTRYTQKLTLPIYRQSCFS